MSIEAGFVRPCMAICASVLSVLHKQWVWRPGETVEPYDCQWD